MVITAEQARFIFDLYRELGIGTQWFSPQAIFKTRLDDTLLEVIDELVRAGLAERNRKQSKVRLTQRALDAYDRWASLGRFDKLRRVNFRCRSGGTCSVVITVTGPVQQHRLETILQADPDFMGISMV